MSTATEPIPASPAASPDRRHASRPAARERRRAAWGDFRVSYPAFVRTMAVAAVALLAADGWLVRERARYERETLRLRAAMSGVERRRADAILAADADHARLSLELLRRQALGDARLHLAVAVDSGRMVLARDGQVLRTMRVDVGPERRVGTPPDTVHAAAPRGARTVERVLGPAEPWEVPAWVWRDRGLVPPATAEARTLAGALGPRALVLSGGTVLYAPPTVGPLNEPTYVMPGAVRVAADDMQAIADALAAGTVVYFH
ncbi:MAG TPA: hypothetical protein VEZ47_07115 [Gemmatirosa sp.]|jgi:hypothetical protein|nr:hypothetical protein [Gemmatirosa sp.]